LSVSLLSKDLFTICQSYSFQRTCSQFVSLTAFKALVHTLLVLQLSKDLFTHCQSYCFQRTYSHIVSLTAFKGLVHTLSVLLLSKDLFTHCKWARSTLNTFGSSPYVWFFQLSYTRNCIHLGKVGMKNLLTFSHFFKVCDPFGFSSSGSDLGPFSLFFLPSLASVVFCLMEFTRVPSF
jgi:hypothetical protein